jgi:hypothetical protein
MMLVTRTRKLKFKPNPVNHGRFASRDHSKQFIAYGVRYRISFDVLRREETGERSWRVYRETGLPIGEAPTLEAAEQLAQHDFGARIAEEQKQ